MKVSSCCKAEVEERIDEEDITHENYMVYICKKCNKYCSVIEVSEAPDTFIEDKLKEFDEKFNYCIDCRYNKNGKNKNEYSFCDGTGWEECKCPNWEEIKDFLKQPLVNPSVSEGKNCENCYWKSKCPPGWANPCKQDNYKHHSPLEVSDAKEGEDKREQLIKILQRFCFSIADQNAADLVLAWHTAEIEKVTDHYDTVILEIREDSVVLGSKGKGRVLRQRQSSILIKVEERR